MTNGAWWGGEPVWVTAERAGLPTATFFWPGSEAEIRGVRPTRTTVYDGKVPVNERIDTVLGWLSESAATRPRFVTLYIEALDDAGHGYGPDSAELRAALRTVDEAMGRLFDGLAARSGPRRESTSSLPPTTVWRRSHPATPWRSRTWWTPAMPRW